MTEKNAIQGNSCRLHTIPQGVNRLVRNCDPKGSEQRCEEFLNFQGGSFMGRPFFLAQAQRGH